MVGPESLFAVASVVEILIAILDIYAESKLPVLGLLVATASLLTLAN